MGFQSMASELGTESGAFDAKHGGLWGSSTPPEIVTPVSPISVQRHSSSDYSFLSDTSPQTPFTQTLTVVRKCPFNGADTGFVSAVEHIVQVYQCCIAPRAAVILQKLRDNRLQLRPWELSELETLTVLDSIIPVVTFSEMFRLARNEKSRNIVARWKAYVCKRRIIGHKPKVTKETKFKSQQQNLAVAAAAAAAVAGSGAANSPPNTS